MEPVDPERQFDRRLVPKVIAADAGAVVAEPDRVIRFDHDIVGARQLLTLEALGQYRDGAVIFGAGQPLRVHLAGDQPPLAIAGIAVGVVRRLAEDADRAGLLLPFHNAVVRDVAPQKVAAVAEPNRPLGKTAARRDPLDRGIAEHQRGKTRIDGLDVSVGVADRRRTQIVARGSRAQGAELRRRYRKAQHQFTPSQLHLSTRPSSATERRPEAQGYLSLTGGSNVKTGPNRSQTRAPFILDRHGQRVIRDRAERFALGCECRDGQRPHDIFGVSLCRTHHDEQHRVGADAFGAPSGHHQNSAIAHWLLARIAEKPELTCRALVAELAERGIAASYGYQDRKVQAAFMTLASL